MSTSHRGLFLVLEGIDGAGTTTQAARLADALEAQGHATHLTREPTTGTVGKLLRRYLEGSVEATDATTMGLLFAADRADHLLREVEPALAAGKVVISDRYYHSSLAYQGSDEERGFIAAINQRARVPDTTFFLRVPVEVAAQRRADASRSEELFDKLETQTRVARGYDEVVEELAASESIRIIDGQRPMDDIASVLLQATLELLKERVS